MASSGDSTFRIARAITQWSARSRAAKPPDFGKLAGIDGLLENRAVSRCAGRAHRRRPPDHRRGCEDDVVHRVELGHEIAAGLVVPRREVTVELAVKRVAGDVLDAGQVGRADRMDREEVGPPGNVTAAVDRQRGELRPAVVPGVTEMTFTLSAPMRGWLIVAEGNSCWRRSGLTDSSRRRRCSAPPKSWNMTWIWPVKRLKNTSVTLGPTVSMTRSGTMVVSLLIVWPNRSTAIAVMM